MRKIPTLFVRDPDDMRHVLPEVHPDCAWVLAGEGIATRKYDGTCVMLDEHGAWWARREVKPGKTPPVGWAEVDHDETTGKRVGWEPAEQSSFARWLQDALDHDGRPRPLTPGTYELCGPKVNGNPERWPHHALIRHADAERLVHPALDPDVPLTYAVAGALVIEMRDVSGWEGIVWHHPDGRMAKLKARDFA